MKTTVHIVPHTHWDREWYMAFERHRMRLVELLDTLIETMEQNPAYTCYHLDGQAVIVEDYLEIRPQNRERLYRLIREGRIQVGPWYVLQDEFLTSGESQIRNMEEGFRVCQEMGVQPVMTGYFPDAFGNISQMPQILRGFDIYNAAFGRGISEIQFDNQVVEGKKPNPSEWRWRSPDGSEVIGIMFSHWYHNAMELPADKEMLRLRLDDLIAAASASASTAHLLGMNGCDHEPVQTDLPEILEEARAMYAEQHVDFVQGNFTEYVEAIRPDLKAFPVLEGELNGQKTSGHGLLINTASTHVPLKQKNHRAQNALEQQAEPLNTLSWLLGDDYRQDFLRYAWRTLIRNHPHDSICCCCVDQVTREMSLRFDKAQQVAEEITNESMNYITARLNTAELEENNLVVFHTGAGKDTEVLTAYVDMEETDEDETLCVTDEQGNFLPCEIRPLGRTFTYTLPKNRFRRVKWVNRYEVTWPVSADGIEYRTYPIKRGQRGPAADIRIYDNGMENAYLALRIGTDGSLEVTDKRDGQVYRGLLYYEDMEDAGDSYNTSPTGNVYTTADSSASVCLFTQTSFSATFMVQTYLERVGPIYTNITLAAGIARVDIRTQIENTAENHRLRVLFTPEIHTSYALADAPFDLVKRDIQPWEGWENSVNSQRCQSMFALENIERGFLVATRGLHEYEIMRDGSNTMALTLLRCVGEVGDWGVFPAPEMQCKGNHTFEYALVPFSAGTREQALRLASSFAEDRFICRTVGKQIGSVAAQRTFLKLEGPYIRLTALRKSTDGEALMLRLYNMEESEHEAVLHLPEEFPLVYRTNLTGKHQERLPSSDGILHICVPPKKMVTLELKKQSCRYPRERAGA